MDERFILQPDRELTRIDLLSILDYRISQNKMHGIESVIKKLESARSVLMTPDMHAYYGARMIANELKNRIVQLRRIIGPLGARLGKGDTSVSEQLAKLTVLDQEISDCIGFIEGELQVPSVKEPGYQEFMKTYSSRSSSPSDSSTSPRKQK